MMRVLLPSVAVVALLSSPAFAQSNAKTQPSQQQPTAKTTEQQPAKAKGAQLTSDRELISKDAAKLPSASAEAFYKGWQANSLIDQAVYGTNNEQLGEVHNLIVDAKGNLSAIIVEGGGFLEIGDAHFRIAWSEVDRTPGKDGVRVTLSQDQASKRGLFDRPEWVATGPREFKISELLGDYVVLRNGIGFGYIADATFDDQGKMLGVTVNRDLTYGPPAYYAYPYYGYSYSWDPGHQFYAIPFDTAEEAGKARSSTSNA
jgi:sporulation protein YlmC with PRC-barrel domain